MCFGFDASSLEVNSCRGEIAGGCRSFKVSFSDATASGAEAGRKLLRAAEAGRVVTRDAAAEVWMEVGGAMSCTATDALGFMAVPDIVR